VVGRVKRASSFGQGSHLTKSSTTLFEALFDNRWLRRAEGKITSPDKVWQMV